MLICEYSSRRPPLLRSSAKRSLEILHIAITPSPRELLLLEALGDVQDAHRVQGVQSLLSSFLHQLQLLLGQPRGEGLQVFLEAVRAGGRERAERWTWRKNMTFSRTKRQSEVVAIRSKTLAKVWSEIWVRQQQRREGGREEKGGL
jgi:hypothetical protein